MMTVTSENTMELLWFLAGQSGFEIGQLLFSQNLFAECLLSSFTCEECSAYIRFSRSWSTTINNSEQERNHQEADMEQVISEEHSRGR